MCSVLVVGADVVARTRAQSENIGRTEAKQDRLADTQILLNYRGRKCVREDLTDPPSDLAPRAGDRAPDCAGMRMENVHSPLRLFDILRGTSFVLVLYYSDPIQLEEIAFLEDLAATLRSIYSSVIKVAAILNAEAEILAIYGVTVLRDEERSVRRCIPCQIGNRLPGPPRWIYLLLRAARNERRNSSLPQ